jgi:Flp pilus assembly protein TadG
MNGREAASVVSRAGGAQGQSLVEFALVLPVFLLLVFAILDVGRVVWANDSVTNAAREAARFAIAHGGSRTTPCPVGPPASTARIPPASPSCPYPSPSKQSIRDVGLRHAVAGGRNIQVTVCYGTDCAGDVDTTWNGSPATNARGTPVTVRVTSDIPLVMGAFLGLSNYSSAGAVTMYVSH